MAYIQCDSDEFKQFKKLKLPVGTALFVSDTKLDERGHQKYLAKYVVDADNKIQLDIDLVEKDRPFLSKEEKEKFLERFDKSSLIDYFLVDVMENEARRPYREYKACSDLEWELFKNIGHHGFNPDLNMGFWNLRIQKEADLLSVKEELGLLLDRVKENFPAVDELPIGISEETCSQYGVYELVLNLKDLTGKVTKTTYGRTSDQTEALPLIDLLKYIQKNHYSSC
jgi:hypothetical protein